MDAFPVIKKLGEKAILIEFEPEISPRVLEKVLALQNYLQKYLLKLNIEVTNTYNSLLISYQSPIEDVYGEVSCLLEEFSTANISLKLESRLFHIPVCYDKYFGVDLEEIAAAKKLTEKEIIDLHSSRDYPVYFIGFLPGFLYLGGLPEILHFPRRKNPRIRVEKGAVGIGEKQTGIYPQASPGGWNIIGNSPIDLFDPTEDPPCEITAGDRIKFHQVSMEEYEQIREEVENGRFHLTHEKYDG